MTAIARLRQPVEQVRCCVCSTAADGTGRQLSSSGWRSLELPTLGETVFYCPGCFNGPSVGSLAQSIRELAEMLAAADRLQVYSERLLEVERLTLRVEDRVRGLRAEIATEAAR